MTLCSARSPAPLSCELNYTQISYSGACATTTDAASKARKFCVDGLGRTISVNEDPSGSLNYSTPNSYNIVDNLTGVTQGSQTRTYVYDMLSRLTSATTPESGATIYTYDAAGNLLSDGVTTYTWDAERRMTTAVVNGTTTTYVYNAFGQRVSKTVGSAYTGLAYDAQGRLMEYNNGSSETEDLLWMGSRLIGLYATGTWFPHPNYLGSTGVVTIQTGDEAQDEIYYPWGRFWEYSGTVEEQRFAGMQDRDAETGLDPTQFRMMSSTEGRWLSPDPLAGDISNPQSLNRYAYVLNNPTNLTDPLGLDSRYLGPACDGYNQPTCPQLYGMSGIMTQYTAAYAGGAPVGSNAGNMPMALMMAAANQLLSGDFIMNAVAIPGVGSPGYQGGGEINLGFKYVVGMLEQDTIAPFAAALENWLGNPTDLGAIAGLRDAAGNLPSEEATAKDLQSWLQYGNGPIPSLSQPTGCFAAYAAYMTQLGKSLLAWYKTHKQPPPPSMTVAPPIPCNATGGV